MNATGKNKLKVDFKCAALVCALSSKGENPSTPENVASFLKTAEFSLVCVQEL